MHCSFQLANNVALYGGVNVTVLVFFGGCQARLSGGLPVIDFPKALEIGIYP